MLNYNKATGLVKKTHYNKIAKVYLKQVNGVTLIDQAQIVLESDQWIDWSDKNKFRTWAIRVNRKAVNLENLPQVEAIEFTLPESFNTERTFGVELEFVTSKSKASIAAAITAAGVQCANEDYNHETRNHWKIVTDGSVSRGWEIVSPILKGEEGIRQLEVVTRVLNQLGVEVDRSTGLHVHHFAGDFDKNSIVNLFNFYKNNEFHIDELVARSRRENNNRYTRSFVQEGAQSLNMNRIENFDRYMKLNYRSFLKYGTLEFRQHQGSVDFVKISNWIYLTQAMVERHSNSLGAMAFNNVQAMVVYLNQDVDFWSNRVVELRA